MPLTPQGYRVVAMDRPDPCAQASNSIPVLFLVPSKLQPAIRAMSLAAISVPEGAGIRHLASAASSFDAAVLVIVGRVQREQWEAVRRYARQVITLPPVLVSNVDTRRELLNLVNIRCRRMRQRARAARQRRALELRRMPSSRRVMQIDSTGRIIREFP